MSRSRLRELFLPRYDGTTYTLTDCMVNNVYAHALRAHTFK